jgi:hypothetical protein
MAMAKQTAQVNIERPGKTATIELALSKSVRGKAAEKLEKAAEAVNGVDNASMSGQHTLIVEVAKAHTGKAKTEKLIAAVLKAIGAEQRGEVRTTLK